MLYIKFVTQTADNWTVNHLLAVTSSFCLFMAAWHFHFQRQYTLLHNVLSWFHCLSRWKGFCHLKFSTSFCSLDYLVMWPPTDLPVSWYHFYCDWSLSPQHLNYVPIFECTNSLDLMKIILKLKWPVCDGNDCVHNNLWWPLGHLSARVLSLLIKCHDIFWLVTTMAMVRWCLGNVMTTVTFIQYLL